MSRVALSLLLLATTLDALGCGSPPSHVYVVTYDASSPAPAPNAPVLLVMPPGARVGLRTSGLAYRYAGSPQQVHYYAHHRWADTPSQMLEPLLVDAVLASGAFGSVVDITLSRLADQRLDTEIVAFDLTVASGRLEARVTVRARLLDLEADAVVFTRVFEAVVQATDNEPAAGVAALDEALAEVLGELAAACAQSARASRLD